jgi:hypothetical protein
MVVLGLTAIAAAAARQPRKEARQDERRDGGDLLTGFLQ